eukprot:15366586-Ditylum_brightwellii.AAC.1
MNITVQALTTAGRLPLMRESSGGLPETSQEVVTVVIASQDTAGRQGSNRVIVADSWIGSIHLSQWLMKIGLHNISNVKSRSADFCKTELQEKLMGDNVECGTYAIATSEINGLKLTALAYIGKSNGLNKSKAKKANFYSYSVAMDCTTNLLGKPAEKKRHHSDRNRTLSEFIPCCKVHSLLYKTPKFQHNRCLSAFVCDILLDNGLLISHESDAPTLRGAMGDRINITLDPKSTYHLVHNYMSFNIIMDVSKHQKYVMCTAEGRLKAASVYCGLCTAMAGREVDHSPKCHAYYTGGQYQCFQHHVANC